MKVLDDEIGICPNCESSLVMYKTNNYKRFIRCEICGVSYPLPKRGKLSNSALICPLGEFPVFIVERQNNMPAYFWSDQPCFSCIKFDSCSIIKELVAEFKELSVYGY